MSLSFPQLSDNLHQVMASPTVVELEEGRPSQIRSVLHGITCEVH